MEKPEVFNWEIVPTYLHPPEMIIVHRVADLRKLVREQLNNGKTVGFVPTMGALHAGHGSLVKESVQENDYTVVSVFVNPTQFGAGEDLDKYPRTLESDAELVGGLGADLVFAPSANEVYPFASTEIEFGIRTLDNHFCGATREGHFNGVVQVVTMLFNMVQPTRAYFGLKDFQQFAILKRMGKELHFPIEIKGCPTVREKDGLAMSSRNTYLNAEERKQALFLHQSLNEVREKARSGSSKNELLEFVHSNATHFDKIEVQYFDVCDPDTLQPIEEIDPSKPAIALMAAFCGSTRLIDNLYLFDA